VSWRFFRRMKIAPGVTVNLSRSGPSLSVGPRGFKKTFSSRGVRTTVGLPGTGLYHTNLASWNTGASSRPAPAPGSTTCPHCGRRVGATWLYCPNCGGRLG